MTRTETFAAVPILAGFLAMLLEDCRGDDSMPEHHDTIHTCPDSTFKAAADICRRFLAADGVAGMLADELGQHWQSPSHPGGELAGSDLYLTAAGHGAGFWDGDYPEHGNTLTEAAYEANKAAHLSVWFDAPGWLAELPADMFQLETYVGDDGHVYICGRG